MGPGSGAAARQTAPQATDMNIPESACSYTQDAATLMALDCPNPAPPSFCWFRGYDTDTRVRADTVRRVQAYAARHERASQHAGTHTHAALRHESALRRSGRSETRRPLRPPLQPPAAVSSLCQLQEAERERWRTGSRVSTVEASGAIRGIQDTVHSLRERIALVEASRCTLHLPVSVVMSPSL